MPPVDSQLPIPVGPQGGAGTMSLATLIEFIIQRTYHELTVLSELLPRKTDMERKIEIVQFASRTRQMFIRLLALVKWANSASKVDKCSEICYFLEKQSMLFVETADMLARMARETLLNARLPNFSLPCAVDVLTTGTYPRLPACIRDKIVPPDPITIPDKRMTLQRLNQVIQYRLVSSDLPQQMRRLRIENGRVKFLVEYEFEVTLTLMGDSPAIPWRLLDIDILVEDHETGSGKNLVHSLQVNYIHQLIQSRLLDNDKPLHDLYRVLHSFCQSLQLEVLHSQTQRLIRDQLGDSIRVEDYSTVGKCLLICYWREQQRKEVKPNELPMVFKLNVHVSEQDPSKPLQITHIPAISAEDAKKVGLAIRSDHLSIEKLLVQTVEIRTLAKLKDLAKDLQKFVEGRCEIKDMPPSLQVPVISPCLPCELLRLAVDIQRGTLLASVSSTDHPVVQDIEDSLNGERRGVEKLLITLRLHLALLRCEKSVQHIPVICQKKLPIINLAGHPMEGLSKHTLFVRLPRHTNFYLVVELPECLSRMVEFKYYLLQVTPTTYDGVELDIAEETGPKTFMRANRLLPLHTYSVTHGPHTKLYDMEAHEMDSITRKRKLLLGDSNETPSKKTKGSPYFVPELCYLLACCDERIPIVFLGAEFEKQGIAHQGLEVDGEGTAMCLTVMELPEVRSIPVSMYKQLRKDLLSCKFRIQGKPYKNWLVEFLFHNNPLKSSSMREQGAVQRAYFSFELGNTETMEKVVADFLVEWGAVAHLYSAAQNFAKVYKDPRSGLQSCVDVRSYDYKRLVLLYGPSRNHVVTISWKSDLFHVSLGTTGSSVTANCHLPVLTQLQETLNGNKSIIYLVQLLSDTWSPLSAIAKLNTMPIYNGPSYKQSFLSFTIIPQTPTHIRIAFRNSYVLDVHCKSGKLVSVRDGAYSLFDSSKCVDGFSPTPGLKAFLNMFVDEAVLASYARRRSTTEDDNPPSPVGMDSLDSMFMSQPSAGSPSSRRQDLRFQSPLTPPSNPHTPASPSTSRVSAGGYPSPAAAFPLTSPPSLPSQVGASPAAFMGTPSPGTLLGANSPGNPHLHVPSPSSFVPAPSPQSLGIHMPSPATSFISPQTMMEGGNSPYPSSNLAMPSPGARNWPNSPSVAGPSPASRHGMAHSPGHAALHSPQMHMKDADHMRNAVVSPPSRMLPPRSWAASIPTLLSHEAFNKLLTPGTLPNMSFLPCSPLERFLGCVYFRRQLHRVVQSDDVKLTYIQCNEPGVTMFKVDGLQLRVSLNPNTLQTLHLKVTPTPTTEMREQYTTEETQVLERFFDIKVACPPYKCNALRAIGRLFGAPSRILKDCIQIMKLELVPQPNLKWSVQWCLTLPPGAANVAPPGTAAIVIKSTKMFLMLQLTRIGLTLPPGTEPPSIVVPLLYDQQTNNINILDQRPPTSSSPSNTAIMGMLKRFAEFHQKPNECAIFPAVRELMSNLVIPVS